VSLLSWLVSTS